MNLVTIKIKRFGIRIENLVLVKKSLINNFYDFETLSLFPYEKDLINKKLLNANQIKWINNYHNLIFKKLSPFLKIIKIGCIKKQKK